jgi:hypothetical protein
METNANSKLLATLLSQAHIGFTGLITTKKPTVRGGVEYGNDQVHVTVFTGFRYDRLVQRSLDALPTLDAQKVVASLANKGHTVTLADVEMARAELKASFESSLAGTNEATTDHVYEPLVVVDETTGEKVTVRSGRVYKCVAGMMDENGTPRLCHCRNCTGDPKAPLPGTTYLQGLQVYSKVLTPAPNGPAPEPKSSAKTLAKNALKHQLPIGRYVSYALEPGTDFALRAGGTARIQAQNNGFVVTDDIVNLMAKAV